MSTDLIRCAGRGHLTVDVLWKKFEIWMGQLKVKVIHASVTQKCWAECNKTMRRFGLDCVKLSGLSAWVAWQLNTIQTKSTHDLAHLAQHFVSDGACFTLTFNCPIQISKFFHKTSTVTCPLPAKLIKSVAHYKIPLQQMPPHHGGNKKEGQFHGRNQKEKPFNFSFWTVKHISI